MKKLAIFWLVLFFSQTLKATSLSFSTFLGGGSQDYCRGIAINQQGNAVILSGFTDSSDFPTTSGAFDNFLSDWDGYITKIDTSGSYLLFSTFLGGVEDDRVYSMVKDSLDYIYLTGFTSSIDFAVTSGSYDTVYNGGSLDTYISKLNPNGNFLVYSTYIGGGYEDNARAISVDNNGNAYIAGRTSSTNFPTTPLAFQTSYNGGSYDGFLVAINQTGTQLTYSTFFGGNSHDQFEGVFFKFNSLFGVGFTFSENFPTTLNAFDNSYNGNSDGFIVKFMPPNQSSDNTNDFNLDFSTFLGNTNKDLVRSVVIDDNSFIYITGFTYSSNFPTTSGCYDNLLNFNSGILDIPFAGGDIFAAKFNPNGTSLVYSTFLGGNSVEGGIGIELDNTNSLYITGRTLSNNFPLTQDAIDNYFDGADEIFISQINSTGNVLLYSTYFGGNIEEYGYSIKVHPNNLIFVGGDTNSPNFQVTSGVYDTSYNWPSPNEAFLIKFSFLTTDLSENQNLKETFSLAQNYPNPFNPKTLINYNLAKKSSGKLVIFNLSGQKIKEFVLTEPEGEIVWNGTDFNGSQVSSGTYFYRLESSEGFSEIKKMTLIK